MQGGKTVLRILSLMLAMAGGVLLYMHLSGNSKVHILSVIAPFIMASALFGMTYSEAFNPPVDADK